MFHWLFAVAEASGPNVVSLDGMGFSGFVWRHVGDFGLIYERRLAGPHALVVEGGFAHVHGPPAHANVGSARVGYRYLLAPVDERFVPFVGAMIGARAASGEHEPVEGEPPTGSWSAVGPVGAVHLGSRLGVVGPLVIGTRLGVAGQLYTITGCDDDGEGACEAADQLLSFSPVTVDAELSVGLAF